ncbi:HAD family hydrolase [Streptomyces sp. NPDC059175]|uniref:HAD family hydrolase n=1 Tax=unclassified Streptomyces TaxID=2593676 RepID=UPI00368E6F28
MQQRLVLFDLDNTLVDRQRTLNAALARFAIRHGLGDDGRLKLVSRFAARATPSDFAEIRDSYRLTVGQEQLWLEYLADMAALSRCPVEVLDGLDELRAEGWSVAVATNGSADIQWAKLRAAGIAHRVDAVCISEECGARKPHPRHFARAAERCGARIDRGGWMVGDHPIHDIAGGHAAGLKTVWIGDMARWPAQLAPPAHAVTSARHAIDLILHQAETRRNP